jgi:hypothetical protein
LKHEGNIMLLLLLFLAMTPLTVAHALSRPDFIDAIHCYTAERYNISVERHCWFLHPRKNHAKG